MLFLIVPMLEVHAFTAAAVQPYLDEVAALRIAVFRDWPYLYDGDAAYERSYLATYAQAASSLFVLAFDGARVVGASTAVALVEETEAIRAPFERIGWNVAEVFYFGESVLLPEYRGRGLGHRFFDEREAHARRLGGYATTAFCSVVRSQDDPRRPVEYRGNDAFWRKRGYAPVDGLRCVLDWPEVGMEGSIAHALQFWSRSLEAA